MENRDLARLLGALCLEERLRIIGGLISAGHEGLSLHELSQITGLDLKIANLHLDHMTGTNMVKSLPSPTGNIFLANLELLEKVFTFMNENYGAGVRLANRAALKEARSTESKTA